VQDIRAGQLVSSAQGRDRGRYFLVFGLLGSRVLLVNGENRTPARPKKKNQRHVRVHPGLSGDLAEKFGQGARVDNAEIKRVLAELTGKAGPDPGEGGKDGDGETGCD
jgi:hypothetical protein